MPAYTWAPGARSEWAPPVWFYIFCKARRFVTIDDFTGIIIAIEQYPISIGRAGLGRLFTAVTSLFLDPASIAETL